ncbi:hypothetical protein L596_008745 [Steinernema carpocapsae]|uniref:Uncharacterized protein n=1 Tax=Steinernema carpocapsae TaxID=34508 RepID=A0A4U5PDE4_STECR|nr:hypothetical protein L596_008745 [Steinernema carpocapsae]
MLTLLFSIFSAKILWSRFNLKSARTLVLYNFVVFAYSLFHTIYNFGLTMIPYFYSDLMKPNFDFLSDLILVNVVIDLAAILERSVTLAGALLAVDRTILIMFPATYKHKRTSIYIVYVFAFITAANLGFVVIFEIVVPVIQGQTTFVAVQYFYYYQYVHPLIFGVDVIFHTIFCLLYRRLLKAISTVTVLTRNVSL